jgi:hypothetical protein
LPRQSGVDNYLGLPGLGGRELMEQFRKHADSLGVEGGQQTGDQRHAHGRELFPQLRERGGGSKDRNSDHRSRAGRQAPG